MGELRYKIKSLIYIHMIKLMVTIFIAFLIGFTTFNCMPALALEDQAQFEFADGPALKRRKMLYDYIYTSKEAGIGVSSYMRYFNDIENRVKRGEDEESINKQIERIERALSTQVKFDITALPVNNERPKSDYIEKIEKIITDNAKLFGKPSNPCKILFSVSADGKAFDVEPSKYNKADKNTTDKVISVLKVSAESFPPAPEGGLHFYLRVKKNAPVFLEYRGLNINYDPYVRYVQWRIKANWHPPSSDITRNAEVSFVVARNGTVSAVKILRSSGVVGHDKAAIQAVNDAAPFLYLPDGSPKTVDVNFTFDYNVWKRDHRGRARKQI